MGYLVQEDVDFTNGTSHRVTSNKRHSKGNLQSQVCMQP